ncbi:hypothetical protein E4T39_05659 [Aureobasidium subglaciale]|nr:hypothetical protein E4T39_05659 [Aureobasidium subglaciale]
MTPALAGGAAVVVAGVTEDVGLDDCIVVLDAVVEEIWDVTSVVAGKEVAELDEDVGDDAGEVLVVNVVNVVDAASDPVTDPEAEVEAVAEDPTVFATDTVALGTTVPPVTVPPTSVNDQLSVGFKLDGKAANADESTESAFVVAGLSTHPEDPAVQEVRVVKIVVSVVRIGMIVAVLGLD